MGKRRKEFNKKNGEDSNCKKSKSLDRQSSKHSENIDKKLSLSAAVVIEHSCRRLAEDALQKASSSSRICPSSSASEKGKSVKGLDNSDKLWSGVARRDRSNRNSVGNEVKNCVELTPKKTRTRRVYPVHSEEIRRRKASLRRISRALGSVRNQRSPKNQLTSLRKSLRAKKSPVIFRPTPSTIVKSSNSTRLSSTKMDLDLDGRDDDESVSSKESSSSTPTPEASNQYEDSVTHNPAVDDDSDDEAEMQVLEKQVDSDKEDEQDEEEEIPADTFLTYTDDTDEESSLLSPSALPAPSVFRSPSRRKRSKKRQEEINENETSGSSLYPDADHSLHRSELSPSPTSSSGTLPEKRGRGRPRKPLSDVKSISGKLYRRKLAERLSAINFNRSHEIARTSTSSAHTNTSATVTSQLMSSNFEDAEEEEEEEEEESSQVAEKPNSHKKLSRWNNRSTFVYAKHKFVSNENKFKCDVCQVSFTALSSLKRHYGTIYHKQQEAAGGSTLDLSDILRPGRNHSIPSTSTGVTIPQSGPSSLLSSREGSRMKKQGTLARTSSIIRRNAVDNIKKYYAAADAARRKREIRSNSTTSSALTSWYSSKSHRKMKPLQQPYLYSSADSDMDDSNDGYETRIDEYEFDEDDIENNFPSDEPFLDGDSDIPEPKQWLSNSWKGVGPCHFTCEVCGAEYSKKLDFTAHLFMHRQEEQQDESLTCADCQTRFFSEKLLNHHYKLFNHGNLSRNLSVQNKGIFPCQKCTSAFPRREYLQKHVLTHRRPKFRCPQCSMQFEFRFYLNDHIKTDHDSGTTIVPPNPSLKPKVELMNNKTPPGEKSGNKNSTKNTDADGDVPLPSDHSQSKNVEVVHRKNNSTPKNIPEFITCNDNDVDETVDETVDDHHYNYSDAEDPDSEPVPPTESETDHVNLIQKFFDSQKGQEPDEKESHDDNLEVGKVGESDGNIVIQFKPMKQFDSFLDKTNKESGNNACMSPLTIEIPRDVGADSKGSETSQGQDQDIIRTDISDDSKMLFSNSKVGELNFANIPPGVLLGCGSNCGVTTKPLENPLTCQDCGKSFEHRKSLVKHVQYYRQGQEFSCTICNKSFRLKHHVSRHMKSFHNIDTNSTSSSTSGDNADHDHHGDCDDHSEFLGDTDPLVSPSGSSSGGLLAIPKLPGEVLGVSGTAFTRKFTTSAEDARKRMSSVKQALSKIRHVSWKSFTMDQEEDDATDRTKKRHESGASSEGTGSHTKKYTKTKTSSVSSESSVVSLSSPLLSDFNYEESYVMVRDSNGSPTFKCLLCKKLYPSKHQLNSHMWYHKRASVFKCNTCTAEFKFKHDLNAHRQVHQSDRIRFKCEKCPKSFSWKKDLLKHLRTKHDYVSPSITSSSFEDKLSRCPFCTLVFPQDGDLDNHIKEVHGKCFVCQICRQLMGSQELLDEHMMQEHDDESGHPRSPSQLSHIGMDSYSQEQEPSSPEFELMEIN